MKLLTATVAAVLLAATGTCSVNVDRDIVGPRDSRDQIRQTDPNDCFYATNGSHPRWHSTSSHHAHAQPMSMRASAWVGAFMLALVVLVVLGGITTHTGAPTAGPTPHPTPTPTRHPNALDTATGITAHSALIPWLVAVAILPFFAFIAIALHARHRSRLVELDRPPLRRPEFVHRAFDVKSLEARRGWLPQSFTYSPHLRQDAAEVIEEPMAALPCPVLTAEQALRTASSTARASILESHWSSSAFCLLPSVVGMAPERRAPRCCWPAGTPG